MSHRVKMDTVYLQTLTAIEHTPESRMAKDEPPEPKKKDGREERVSFRCLVKAFQGSVPGTLKELIFKLAGRVTWGYKPI